MTITYFRSMLADENVVTNRIELHVGLDLVAGHEAGGSPVGGAEAEQVAAPHDSDAARRAAVAGRFSVVR